MKSTDMKPTALREYLKRLNTQRMLEEKYGDPAQARLLREEATAVRWYLKRVPTLSA